VLPIKLATIVTACAYPPVMRKLALRFKVNKNLEKSQEFLLENSQTKPKKRKTITHSPQIKIKKESAVITFSQLKLS
jgi:hypothetical protein